MPAHERFVAGLARRAAGLETREHSHNTVLTPITALAANTDNYAPVGWAGDVSILRISASTPVNLTGITGGYPGRQLRLVNIGATNAITLTHDATSTAEHRFYTGGVSLPVAPGVSVDMFYDAASLRWRVLGLTTSAVMDGDTAGGDLSGTYPNPSVVDDSHLHAHANTTGKTANDHHNQAHSIGGADHTGTIATAQIAANAVTQSGFATGPVSANHTTTVDADVTDMTVTLTTTGGDLVVFAVTNSQHSVSNGRWFHYTKLDGTTNSITPVAGGQGGRITRVIIHRYTGVSAASHTVVTKINPFDAGTVTTYQAESSLLVVELKK